MGWVLIFNRAGKYDESNGAPIEGNTKLEITWTIIPLVTVFLIATYSMNVNMKLQTLGPKHKYTIGTDPTLLMEPDPMADVGPIDVIARQWSWEFIYPDGIRSSELHLPIDQRVNFRMISQDVLHSFYVPAFRLKQDIIPGSIISYSLTPTKEGRFRLRDAMFSGAYFSQNQTDVIVETKQAYDDWLETTARQPLQPGLDPGRALSDRRIARGDKGWATVPPAPPPLVNDPGDSSIPHDA
jgi:cytochrome c oxidase subunit 2